MPGSVQHQAEQRENQLSAVSDAARSGQVLHRRHWRGQGRPHCSLQEPAHQH